MSLKSKFFILIFVSLGVYYILKKNKDGFENKYKNSLSLSSRYNYYKGYLDLKSRQLKKLYTENIKKPINKKINSYINRYF
tara:strand:- start:3 stop:245 length:243 start_codon:yes stop_codon:yes gene_type:complete